MAAYLDEDVSGLGLPWEGRVRVVAEGLAETVSLRFAISEPNIVMLGHSRTWGVGRSSVGAGMRGSPCFVSQPVIAGCHSFSGKRLTGVVPTRPICGSRTSIFEYAFAFNGLEVTLDGASVGLLAQHFEVLDPQATVLEDLTEILYLTVGDVVLPCPHVWPDDPRDSQPDLADREAPLEVITGSVVA